ncbi:MAG TPA: tetratricopeptide repeat protein [Pyrinomonadaceae bacterium]|jgi:tetratricopeptide (TPR) repeat protein
MAFDKAKAVSAAEKNLAQGKIAAAVQEYRRIVEADAEDYSALNTLGDLYARLDKKAEAVQCFVRVADHYREQGFSLKAIAIYKKVARLRPDELSVAQKLASLYEQQGLIVEARAQYLFIADACTRAQQPRDALEALRRTADLDPQNADIRLRLAEGFMREEMRDEAAAAFAEAGTRLHARSDYHGALRAFKLAHEVRPYSHEILQGLVDAHLALGSAEDAASVLEEAVAHAADDLELQAMIVRVYLDAEDAPAADRAATKLVNADIANYPLLFEVTQVYLQQGDTVNAVRALTRAVEPALAKRQEKPLLELLNQALARDPENIEALRLLLRIHTWQRDDERMRIALERLAEAAQAQELYDDERNALEHLVRLVPFDQGYAERLTALGELLGADAPRTDGAPREGILTTGEAAAYAEPSARTAAAPPATAPPDFASMFESNSGASDLFTVPPPTPAQTPAPAGEFEWNAIAPPAVAPEQPADASASFADLNAEFADEAVESVEFSVPLSAAEEHEIHVTNPLDDATLAGVLAGTTGVGDDRVQALLAQELESVDYYLAQGYGDIARDTLDMLERQYGASAEISQRRKQLQGPTAPVVEPLSAPPPNAVSDRHAQNTPPAERAAFQMPVAQTEPAEATAQAAQPPAFKPAAQPTGAGVAASALDAGLAEVFAEFRDSVEDDGEDATADYETHYNTGLAYMEMGMLDMAVEEFQTAVTVAAPGDGTPRYLQCCNLLGHCFMQQRMERAAVLWFKKGLAAPGHGEEEYQALRYELGTAYEQAGDLDRAIDTFQEVYGIDVSYRGVADKLRELQMQRMTK